MDDDYGRQDASMYTDTFDSNTYKISDLNNAFEIDVSNDLSYTRDKDYSLSSEHINSEPNIFSKNNINADDNITHPSESQASILDVADKHETFDSENSNIQNDEYLLDINQDIINKDDSTNKNTSCCTGDDSMMCLEACCTCFCL